MNKYRSSKKKWITDCDGPWRSIILLAPKPRQEDIHIINNFVWRLCVSYRSLNIVTKPFTFPIPRCAESVEDFGYSNGPILFITLDARQEYHQILVRFRDREKLAFFTPDGKKETSHLMPFGPNNHRHFLQQ